MTDPIFAKASCATCGAALPLGKLEGQCAVCLVEMIFRPETAALAEASGVYRLAGYELLEEIGRGGMGRVYRAWQPSLRRIVALKLLIGGTFASQESIARFKKEAQIAAGLHHPHLVPIYEADEADGQPYYVMELITGQSLGELTRGTPLPAEKAARYLLATARAVEYAHSQGVLHRDLKPSNILIDSLDQPRVADFGLARSQYETLDLTQSGEAVGSPAFMAPELAGVGKNLSSPSTDLYALGGVLYQALTGRPPFQGECVLQILDQAKNTAPVSPRELVPTIPVDLETVCLKCLEKEPAQRYSSVADFADDLARFLAGEPVLARPVSRWIKAWRWTRKRPALACTVLALVGSIIVGNGLVLRKARENQLQATAIHALSVDVRGQAYVNGIESAVSAWRDGKFAIARNLLARSPGPADPEFRDFTARWLAEEIKDPALATLPGQGAMVFATRFSQDGRWLATGGQDGICRIYEVATRQLLRQWQLPSEIYSIHFSPDDTLLYLGTGQKGRATGVSVWQRESTLKTAEYPGSLASLSADGTRLATVEADFFPYWGLAGPVRVWETTRHRLLREWPGDYRQVAITADGQSLAMAASSGEVTLVNLASGAVRGLVKLTGVPRGLRFSPDGRWLGAWSHTTASVPDGVILDTQGQQPPAWIQHPQQLVALAFSPDSQSLMTAGSDYIVRRWSCTGQQDENARLLGSQDEIWALDFHPQQALLATGNKVGDVTLWSTHCQPPALQIPHLAFERPTFSRDSHFISTQETTDTYVLRDATSGEIKHRLPIGFFPLRLGPELREVIGYSPATAQIRWWDPVHAAEVRAYPCPGLAQIQHPHWLLRVSQDGQKWLTLDAPGKIGLHRSSDGTLIDSWSVPEMDGSMMERDGHLALSPDASLAAWNPTGSSTVWLLRHGQPPLALKGHRLGLTRLEFSPDSLTLATASIDHTIRLWDTVSGKFTTLPGHFEEVSDVSFSPDGRLLASVALGDSIKIWQLRSGRELLRLDHATGGAHLVFSPDGRTLAINADWLHPFGPSRSLKFLRAP